MTGSSPAKCARGAQCDPHDRVIHGHLRAWGAQFGCAGRSSASNITQLVRWLADGADMKQVVHLAARAWPGLYPLQDAAVRQWLWVRLRRRWPEAVAACVMPDHVHVLEESQDARESWQRLRLLLSGLTRHLRMKRCWMPLGEPGVVAGRQHLARQVRYVHLNPCRAGLVRDPLAWPWSTHRGVVGAEVDPWVTADRLAAVFDRGTRGFAEWFHGYVSGDPAAAPEGTAFPTRIAAQQYPTANLADIARAARSACAWLTERDAMCAAMMLARHQGWTDAKLVAAAVGVHPQTVRRIWRNGKQSATRGTPRVRRITDYLAAGSLCLGDPRLCSMEPVPAHAARAHIGSRSRDLA